MTETARNNINPRSPGVRRYRPALRGSLGLFGFTWAMAINLLICAPLFAIPSPDVVIGIFASVGQVLGLLAVSIGGVLFARKRRRDHLEIDRRGSKAGIPSWLVKTLLAVLVVSATANVLQYCRSLDRRNERLQRNLVRPEVESGIEKKDSSLKTLGLDSQREHPLGLGAEELQELISTASPFLVDVREPEEIEMGSIEGSHPIRYPDIKNDPGLVPGGKTLAVLLCFSGNRSSELCDLLTSLGYDCRFLIGGYEKWIADEFPMRYPSGRAVDELRGLPEFTNKRRLLDTPEVEELVSSEGAVFVDVRYEEDFLHGHLPDAINIPVRKMTSAEIETALDRRLTRDTPVIIAAYGKRSSFYGQVLGLKLLRKGGNFLGLYTVPHEYSAASPTRPHVLEWERANRSDLLSSLGSPFRHTIEWLRGVFGHLAIAILISVLLLRVALLPLSFKTERDQARAKGLEGKIAGLRKKLDRDPERLLRATNALRKKNGITPVINLLATGLQVFVMLLFCTAINTIGTANNDALGWIPNLSTPDPLLLLPLCLGLTVLAHVLLSAGGSSKKRLAMAVAFGALLFAISYNFSAAVNFYLVLSIGTGLLQTLLFSHFAANRKETTLAHSAAPEQGAVVDLAESAAYGGCGNKAARLGIMIQAGLPVPGGFVLTAEMLEAGEEDFDFTARDAVDVEAAWKAAGVDKAAVRSSGLNEDGSSKSYAGIFDSVLNVDREGLLDAVRKVRSSLSGGRVSSYGVEAGERGGIVIQKMVAAEYAGVLFTEHPSETGSMLVELVEGLGEALVSGTATPSSFRFGRFSGLALDEHCSPIDLTPLVELGAEIEELFGSPQDIEWAYHEGSFLILQARNVTTRITENTAGRPGSTFELERKRLLELAAGDVAHRDKTGETVFHQNELSELLPRPTPLSFSLMQSLWEPGGSTDLACRTLGIPYEASEDGPALLTRVFGQLYINRDEEKRRSARGPGLLATFQLTRDAGKLKRQFLDGFLPGYQQELKIREAIDLSRLETSDLLELFSQWKESLCTGTHVQVEIINIAAEFYMRAAERALKGKVPVLHNVPQTIVSSTMALLPAIKRGERDAADFLDVYGHRSPHDYELAAPRYSEDPGMLTNLVERSSSEDHPLPAGIEDSEQPSTSIALIAAERASQFQALKEEAKHHCLREFALLRRLLLELDQRLELQGNIFYLTLEEIENTRAGESADQLLKLAEDRKNEEDLFGKIELKTRLSMEDLETLQPGGSGSGGERSENHDLSGAVVAGNSWALGAARVLHSPDEIDSFKEGEILVARFTDPSWTPVFSRAAGLITEVGGHLSHAAILARELDVPAIVGVEGATSSIRTGDLVRMNQDGGIKLVANYDGGDAAQPRLRASLRRQDEILEAMVVNVSRNGATVSTDRNLVPGQDLKVVLDESETEIQAKVVSRRAPGKYSLRFDKPLGKKGLDDPLLS
ncbi:MAG: PEP/pyruvate-binding domain-containing protein [Planctomycetota bacterium]|nr:PEP/pyruvate-binding domain-containing protein [Planctomycetota bacterium]